MLKSVKDLEDNGVSVNAHVFIERWQRELEIAELREGGMPRH
jgi:hypothetical protein